MPCDYNYYCWAHCRRLLCPVVWPGVLIHVLTVVGKRRARICCYSEHQLRPFVLLSHPLVFPLSLLSYCFCPVRLTPTPPFGGYAWRRPPIPYHRRRRRQQYHDPHEQKRPRQRLPPTKTSATTTATSDNNFRDDNEQLKQKSAVSAAFELCAAMEPKSRPSFENKTKDAAKNIPVRIENDDGRLQ